MGRYFPVLLVVIAVAIGFVVWTTADSEPTGPISEAHSSNAAIERFYRETESFGMGFISATQVRDMAKKVCNGEVIALMGPRDYTAEFKAASLRVCNELS